MPSILHVMFSNISATLGIVFNGYIIFVFMWNHKIHTPNRLLLLHLAIVDIIFSLVILLYNTTLGALLSDATSSLSYDLIPKSVYLSDSNSSANSSLCQGHGFLWTLLPIVMVWNVCGLSFDRYAAIYTPLHYSRIVNVRRVSYFVLACWTLGIALAIPPLLDICPYVFWDARWACTANCLPNTSSRLWYSLIQAILAIALPLLIMLFCNLHMLLLSHYQRHRIVTAIYEVTLSAQATITHQRNPCYLSKFKGRNALFTITQIVGSLVFLIVPYYGVFVWESANGTESNPILISISTFFLTCTPPVNAYVYGIKSRVLRQTLKRLLHQHLHQSGTHRNIKHRLSEIFSDPTGRPVLNRRLSAPADYCRTFPSIPSMPKEQRTCEPRDKKRYPFARSISLPLNAQSNMDVKPPQQTTESKKLPRGFLKRGESAPEDTVVPCEDDGDVGMASWKQKRQMYARSSTFPIEQETFRIRRKKRLDEIRKLNQSKFESICVPVDEDQSGEECTATEEVTPSIYESVSNRS